MSKEKKPRTQFTPGTKLYRLEGPKGGQVVVEYTVTERTSYNWTYFRESGKDFDRGPFKTGQHASKFLALSPVDAVKLHLKEAHKQRRVLENQIAETDILITELKGLLVARQQRATESPTVVSGETLNEKLGSLVFQ